MLRFFIRAVAKSAIFVGLGSMVITYKNLSMATDIVSVGVITLLITRERR